MRRTYRSKKETSAFDHRDAIQALDEKASAFEAFYIQNIKQTKRELSCTGSSNHFGAATNKIRKRKYVKRIVKEPEASVSESACQSAFLTPDKSIRVNKAQDLFDQLLNSSSPRRTESSRNRRQNAIKYQPRVEGKTYSKQKLTKIKKFNFSSSDSSETDKENSKDCNNTRDVSDIITHELLIEKDKPSPKYLDESINKIVKNMSLINKLKGHKNICSRKTLSNNAESTISSNFQSPNIPTSPLCSTPFREKYRGKSIFKFSPIVGNRNEASPNYVTIVEEKDELNDSVVFIDKKHESAVLSANEGKQSPIIHLSVNKSTKSDKSGKMSRLKMPILSTSRLNPKPQGGVYNVHHEASKEITSIEKSDLQVSEVEPFLGFSNKSIVTPNKNPDSFQTSSSDSKLVTLDNSKLVHKTSDNKEIETDNSICLVSDNDSSYDTCNSEQLSQDDEVNAIRVPIVVMKRLDDSIFKKHYEKIKQNYIQEDMGKIRSNSLESDNYASFNDSSTTNNDSCSSTNSTTNSKHLEVASNISKEEINYSNSVILENTILSNFDQKEDSKEESCISFVTTRRRNEISNKSIVLDFNNSFSNTNSDNYDMTDRNNKNNECIEKDDCNLSVINTTVTPDDKIDLALGLDTKCSTEENSFENVRPSSIAVRKSSRTFRDSFSACRAISDKTEQKPAIVLQPGKKWERSLSIYRRMTMITDNFNNSILEDDQLHNKGRKYRQSVISTMEMQDLGSLQNESIISRRSTFVSKLCRPTIRIVKESNFSRLSLCSTTSDDLKGFLTEDCDDTIVELSKLSIADSEHEVTVLENFHDSSSRVSTARDYVLRRCNQTEAIGFDECYPETVLKNCRKIGEGVYGEVFLWRARDGRARVMKIVPIAGSIKVNGEQQKDFQEIISEIVIAMELSALRAPIDEIQRSFDEGKNIDALDLHSVENATDVFNEVLAVKCVYGTYPSRLLDLWELYDECNGSENDNPAILPCDQQYIVLELANAGQDLESYEFNNAEQAHALFLQVAYGLAVAEEAYQFEHRDLHWGNVLIAPTDQKSATFVLRGRAHHVPRCGVSATIIDYSLSRISLPLAADSAALYNDLAADDGLFDAVGDYQFEVYRLMREKLGNDWKNFEPYTNILWLHYIVGKMILGLRYKRAGTKVHKHFLARLRGIQARLLAFGGAAQFVLTDIEF